MVKYPYIANKKLYAATMFACKIIRENGFSERAIETAADYYGVSGKAISNEIRKRRNAKAASSKVTYHWYVVETLAACDANPVPERVNIFVKRATSEGNATSDWERFNRRNDYGGNYAPYRWDRVVATCGSKKEAEAELKRIAP